MAISGPYSFSRGYSGGYAFNNMPEGYASIMMNMRLANGSVSPRWGQFVVNTSTLGASKNVCGLSPWTDQTNSKTILAAICNAKFSVGDFTGYTDITGTQVSFTDRTGAVSLSASQTIRYTFDSLNGLLVGAGNSSSGGVPFSLSAYNTNIINLAGSPPAGDIVKQVNNFMFIGGQSANPSQVSWSNVQDPTTWNAGNNINFRKGDGESVTALGAIGTTLYIFKPHSIGALSTTTNVISGVVTLGPLTTVSVGIGCCGALAIDNLPNGNLVFLGTDCNVYVFDGSVIVNISKQQSPGPNVYDGGDRTYGLSNGFPDTLSTLKVFKGLGEVWVGFDRTDTDGSVGPFVYDYLNSLWQGLNADASGDPLSPKSSAILPVSGLGGFLNSSEYLFFGTGDGNIVQQNYSRCRYPQNELGGGSLGEISCSVRVGNSPNNFIPRCIIFEIDQITSGISSVNFYYTWDATFNGGVSVWTNATFGFQRAVIPLILTPDANKMLPSVLTLTWQFSSSGVTGQPTGRIGQFWLSDEIER